jgi:sec-independent protein translocase protein TatC
MPDWFDSPEEGVDLFEDTRMSLGDHIEELRRRLLLALAGLGVALVAGFLVSRPVLEFIMAPAVQSVQRYRLQQTQHALERLAAGDHALGAADEPREIEVLLPAEQVPAALRESAGESSAGVPLKVRIRPLQLSLLLREASTAGQPPELIVYHVSEPMLIYFKVSVYAAFVLASPWIFLQLWLFVAAGLHRHEKRLVHVYLPLSVFLFLGGVALCEFVVLPTGVDYLLGFNEWLGADPELRLQEWLDFALLMPLVFGCCFQTPLVMMVLDRLGICTADTFRRQRRLAVFLLAILAAIVSATPDCYNMLALTLPLWGLYEVGILLCRGPRPEGSAALEGIE